MHCIAKSLIVKTSINNALNKYVIKIGEINQTTNAY